MHCTESNTAFVLSPALSVMTRVNLDQWLNRSCNSRRDRNRVTTALASNDDMVTSHTGASLSWGSTMETETRCSKEALREILKKIKCRDLVLYGTEELKLKQEKMKQPEKPTAAGFSQKLKAQQVRRQGVSRGPVSAAVGTGTGACRESDHLSWRMWHCAKRTFVRLSQEQRQHLASLLLLWKANDFLMSYPEFGSKVNIRQYWGKYSASVFASSKHSLWKASPLGTGTASPQPQPTSLRMAALSPTVSLLIGKPQS